MSRRSTNFRTLARKIWLGLAVVVLLSVGSSSVVKALGYKFWDDSGSNCDVYKYDGSGGAGVCGNSDYNVALVATNTGAVPKGATTVHIIYKSIPTVNNAGKVVDASAGIFTNNRLKFDIVGSSWCPTYAGPLGINKKDSANGGVFADPNTNAPRNISVGTQVTNFEISDAAGTTDLNSSKTNFNYAVGEYQNTKSYCDPAGGNFVTTVNVQPDWLVQQKGFPGDVWYVELSIVPKPTIKGQTFYDPAAGLGSSSNKCDQGSLGQCEGISNKFRVQLDTSSTSWGYNNGYYKEVSGSSLASNQITPGSDDFTMTYTNASYDFNSAYKTLDSKHYSVVARYGADCSVLSAPGGTKAVRALLYDIDDSGANGDIQKALLVKIDKNNKTWVLTGGFAAGTKGLGAVGTWKNTANINNWSQGYNSPGAQAVDNTNSNGYTSISYTASVGDKYELYLYDTRVDLVNQIGPTFDSVYYDNPCTAAVHPDVSFINPNKTAYAPGDTLTATSRVLNTDNMDITNEHYDRTVWLDDGSQSYGAGDKLVYQSSGSSPVTANFHIGHNADDPINPSPSQLNDYQFTIDPATTAKYVCTSLALSNVKPDGAVVTANPAVDCRTIGAPGAQPYFSVLGGDIAAGPGFGAGCTNPSGASIIAHFNDTASGNTYGGASSQLAALALTDIKGFATGKFKGSLPTWYDSLTGGAGSSSSESDLAFANAPATVRDAASQVYGGSVGIGNWCVDDYYNTADPGTPKTGGVTVNTYVDGTTSYDSGVTLNAGTIGKGQHVVIRVNGDVYINGNIGYNLAGVGTTTDIPSFKLLATGKILVDGQDVSTLYGFYDAQGGPFVTCATDSVSPAVPVYGAAALNICTKPLTVYGAVATKQLVPNRISGDINNAAGQTPAETFQFSPQFWLGNSNGSNSLGPWDSVTSLPPIL